MDYRTGYRMKVAVIILGSQSRRIEFVVWVHLSDTLKMSLHMVVQGAPPPSPNGSLLGSQNKRETLQKRFLVAPSYPKRGTFNNNTPTHPHTHTLTHTLTPLSSFGQSDRASRDTWSAP